MSVWAKLSKIDCNAHKKQKGKLSYLSWAWAWSEFMNVCPQAKYKFKDPVFFADGSCEVWVTVTVDELSHDMWLPVMDHKNNSVINPNSRDISDTRMRCLTKCLAMFGLGFYIYAGEDLPDSGPVDHSAVIARYSACTDQDQRNEVWNNITPAEQVAINEALT